MSGSHDARGRTSGVVVALFGPTGMGKTEVAVSLAERLGTEVVSADSMQVYDGLPIVTNQPTPDQLARVPHHLVGVVSPAHDYSVAEYAAAARLAVDDVVARCGTVVVEGGSGLYLRAALGGLTFGTPPDERLRAELERQAGDDPAALRDRLRALDPDSAARIDLENPRRLVRALETVIAQGAPLRREQYDRLWDGRDRGPDDGRRRRLFCLDVDREGLRARIDRRVERMFAAGLVDEVDRALRSSGGFSRTVRQAIGVEEALGCIAGTLTVPEAVGRTQARTRRYVRRQLTWMRKLRDADIIPAFDRSPDDVAHDIGGRVS